LEKIDMDKNARKIRNLEGTKLPAIFISKNNTFNSLIFAEEINKQRDVENLKELLMARIKGKDP